MKNVRCSILFQSSNSTTTYLVDEFGNMYRTNSNNIVKECKCSGNGRYQMNAFASGFRKMIMEKGNPISSYVNKSWVKSLYDETQSRVYEVGFLSKKDEEMTVYVPEFDKLFKDMDSLLEYICQKCITHEISIFELKKKCKPKMTLE